MKEFHRQIAADKEAAGVRVIWPPHALGFLDRSPARKKPLRHGRARD